MPNAKPDATKKGVIQSVIEYRDRTCFDDGIRNTSIPFSSMDIFRGC